jgi:ATP-binding cassette subfamily B protein
MLKKSTNLRTVAYFWQHAKRYPALALGVFCAAPIAYLANVFLPSLIVSGILNRLASGEYVHGDLWGSFGPSILLAIGLSAFGGILMWRVNDYLWWKLEGNVVRDIHTEIFDHLIHLSASFHSNSFGGSLVSQANKLATAYVRMADTTMFNTGLLFWSLVFSNILLLGKAPVFVLLLDIISVVFMMVAARMTRSVRQRSADHAETENRQTGQLADSITNVMAIKSFAAERRENSLYQNVSERERHARQRMALANMTAQTGFSITNNVLYALGLIAAVASVVLWNADVGVVFLVMAFLMEIRTNLWEFANTALRNYNRSFGEAQGMLEILDTPPGVADPARPLAPAITKGSITFRSMSFTHADSARGDSLFENLNLDVRPGEKIGLVGHSGSGKTTLTKLLLRFSDVDSGEILIDGQDIAQLAQADLRQHIAYVPQEPLLFHRSIRENIAYGKRGATEAQIKAAARHANASEFIDKMPKGYETLVGERGVKLSGGQRQRIAIARAMIKDAPILVLDEATSALDSESEKLIQSALWELMKGRTAIVIAHRLSTVQKMDRIIVLDNGAIIESGTHNQLIAKKGAYASLWAHQSGGFLEE